MILVDISSVFHRMIHVSSAVSNPSKQLKHKVDYNGEAYVVEKFITSEFSQLLLKMIFEELMTIQKTFKPYGEMIICLDDFSKKYWRHEYYNKYKSDRKKSRDESEIDYSEVFAYLNELTNQIRDNLPWKVVSTPGAEADDVILVLAREYGTKGEPILIHSPDKDLIQAQLDNPNVKQYSSLTKKWLIPENKHESMGHWIREHVFLGDGADGIPRIIDETNFSESFKEHLSSLNIREEFHEVHKFKQIDYEKKKAIISRYDTWKTNKKGEPIELDIYEKLRFGSSNLEKIFNGHYYNKTIVDELKKQKDLAKSQGNKELVKELNGKIKNYQPIVKTEQEFLDLFLDSHPLYREHYERNFTLIMEQGIPNDIWNSCIADYISAEAKYNEKEFVKYLEENYLLDLKKYLSEFEVKELTAENCGW